MNASPLFDNAFCVHLTLALLHFLWQGALLAGGVVPAVWLLGRGSPQRRYRVYLAALVLMLLCFPVTLGAVVRWSAGRTPPATDFGLGRSSAAAVRTALASRHDPAWRSSEAFARTEPAAAPSELTAAPSWRRWDTWALWIAWSYLAGVAIMLARVSLAVLGGRRLRRRTTPLTEPDLLAALRVQVERFGLRIAPSVAWCDRVLVPVAIGLVKPAVLLPASLATGLTPAQLQLVIAHELAHLYRWDHIALVFQRVVEAVFFFHPAVWYFSRRLSVERELCCDELVLSAGGSAGEYAESLLRVVELSRPAARPAPRVAVAMASGRQGSRALVHRLSRILGQPECSPVRLTHPGFLALGLACCLAAALGLLAGDRGLLARAIPGDDEQAAAPAGAGVPATAPQPAPADRPAVAPSARPGELRGRVVHAATGAPAVDADVRLIKKPDGAFVLPLKPQRVRSDDRGEFAFTGLEQGTYLVYAFLGNAASRTQKFKFEKVTLDNERRQQTPVQLQLRPGVTLRVRATSEATGKTLPGAFVRFGWTDADDGFQANSQGEAVIPALTAEQWHIEVAAPGHCRVFRDLKLNGPETVLDIALRPGGELLGLVCDQAGQPLAGAEVSAGDDSGGGMYRYDQTKTGADGTFQLRFLPLHTPLDVSASRDGYQYASTKCSVPADRAAARAVEIRLEPLADGGAVTGRVVDTAGRPVAGATLRNHGNSSDQVRESQSDAEGRFRLERLFVQVGDRVALIVRADGYAPQEITVAPEPRRGTAPLALTLQPGAKIRGRVVNQQGQPIAHCRVFFAAGDRGFGHIGGRIEADEQGRFSSNSLPPGCDFTFAARGYSALVRTLPLNQQDEVLVTLEPIGVVRGRVVNSATGRPVGEFNVRLRFPSDDALQPGDQRPSGGIPSTRIDPGEDFLDREGRFQLDDLDSGVAWELLIQARGYQPLRVPRAISSPADKAQEFMARLVPVQADELVPLRGRLVDPNGAPAGGVEVRLLITEPAGNAEFLDGEWTWIAMETNSLASRCLDYRRAITNAKGEFEFVAVPRKLRLTLAYWSAKVPAGLVDHLEQRPVAELGNLDISHGRGVTVRGTVDRRAFPDAAEVAIDGDMKQVRGHRRSLADGQTEFEFQGVEPGKLQVTLRDRGSPGSSPGSIIVKSIATREVTAQAGQTVAVSFDGGAEEAAAKPAPSKLSPIEAFLTRVETPPPPRRGRLSRHVRNAQGAIVALRLKGAKLEKADFAVIGQLGELESLDLSETSVSDEDLRSLAGLAKLRELRLWDTRIDGSGLAYLAGLEHLERLELADTKVTDATLRHLSKVKSLRHLVLIRAPIGDSGLAHLADLRGLQSLKLGGTIVTDEGLHLIRGLEELRGLTLDGTNVRPVGLKELAELPRFAWAASATATAEEFVRRIERGDHQALDAMLSVGLDIPDRGQFKRQKFDAVPPSEADRARGWQRFHVEMHWTVEAEKLDTTFFADFVVDRAAVIVHQTGIREQDTEVTFKELTFKDPRPAAGTPVEVELIEGLDVWLVKGNLRDVGQLMEVIKQVDALSPTNASSVERLNALLVSRGWRAVVRNGKIVVAPVGANNAGRK